MPPTKSIALVLGGVIVIVVITIAVILIFQKGGSLKETLSEAQLLNTTNFMLKEKGTAKFISDNKTYTLLVDSISEKYLNLTILNTTIITKVNIGQIRNLDLEEDGTKDITIQLNNISNNKANLSIKKFFECKENWSCTDWTSCNTKNRTRQCTDTTNCGTELNKPDTFQNCRLNCSAQNGKICSSTQTCNGTITTAEDGQCCIGTCQGASIGIEAGTCGSDINCLITAAETCSITNLTYTSASINNGTWTQAVTHYYKIREYEDEKCKIRREIISISGSFTDSKRQELLAEGKTEAEITNIQNEIIDALIGETGICKFSTYNLVERLKEMKNGKLFITKDELTNYECSGELAWIY